MGIDESTIAEAPLPGGLPFQTFLAACLRLAVRSDVLQLGDRFQPLSPGYEIACDPPDCW